MKRIVTTRDWTGTITELTTSTSKFENGSRIYVTGDSTRYKVANGIDAIADLPFITGDVKNRDAVAIDETATATGAELKTGLVTSTSAAATAITLPSAADLLSALKASAKASFDLIVDNSAGASTVTVTPSASITAATAVVTGGATLTVAAGAVGLFKIYFSSATVAKIYRVG